MDNADIDIKSLADAVGVEQTPKSALSAIFTNRTLPANKINSAANRIYTPGLEVSPGKQ